MMRPYGTCQVRPLHALASTLLGGALLTACTQQPTPYQPLAVEGGYQETRIQERVYQVKFQGNPKTLEAAVMDMALLRCAELTRAAGYAGFAVLGRSAVTKRDTVVRPVPDDFMPRGRRSTYSYPRYESVTYVNHHVATLLVRMLTADEVKAEKDAFDADDLLRRLEPYREPKVPS